MILYSLSLSLLLLGAHAFHSNHFRDYDAAARIPEANKRGWPSSISPARIRPLAHIHPDHAAVTSASPTLSESTIPMTAPNYPDIDIACRQYEDLPSAYHSPMDDVWSQWKAAEYDLSKTVVTVTGVLRGQTITTTITAHRGSRHGTITHGPVPTGPCCVPRGNDLEDSEILALAARGDGYDYYEDYNPYSDYHPKGDDDDDGEEIDKKLYLGGPAWWDRGWRWLTTIELGTPPQLINVELNTGSNDFWVYPIDKDWALHPYNASDSSTHVLLAHKKFKSVDQRGSVSGTVMQDVIWLRAVDSPPALPSNCTFGLVTKANHPSAVGLQRMADLSNQGSDLIHDENLFFVDGMLGLGMVKLDDKRPTSFLPWLARTQNVTFFTLSLQNPESIGNDGYFTFGYIDEAGYNGNICYTPAKRTKYRNFGTGWGVSMTSFEIVDGEKPPRETNIQVLLDSDSPTIHLPKELVKDYYREAENATYVEGQWQLPCSLILPEMRFRLQGGFVGSLTDPDMAPLTPLNEDRDTDKNSSAGLGEDEKCIGPLQEVKKGGQAIFGLPVFFAHYLVFDLLGERVGFAESVKPKDY